MPRLPILAAALTMTALPALAAPKVVTDMSPTGALVQEVMGDLGEVHVLLPRAASAHQYTMRPSDARALQGADLLVWMGPELTPWLDKSAANLADQTQQLRLLSVEDTILQDYAEDEDDHAGHDDHGTHDDHDHEAHDHDHEGHDHHGIDPHAWLNPQNAAPWLQGIAAALAEQDPQNASTYQANADAAAKRIAELDATLSDQLAPWSDASFVVFHDAYSYFTRHFGLKSAVALSLGDATTPSAARVQMVREQVVDSGAVCAFPEYAHDPVLLTTVIEGTGTRIGGELSPEGADGDATRYDDILTGLADTLVDCFEG